MIMFCFVSFLLEARSRGLSRGFFTTRAIKQMEINALLPQFDRKWTFFT